MAIAPGYVYRQHNIIYNDIKYGMCPFGQDDPIDMLCIGNSQIEFDPFKPTNTYITDTITFITTYKIIESKIFITSLEVFQYCEKSVENEDGIIYVESLDKIFKDITDDGVFAEFISGVIEFDDYDEEGIDDGNYNKFYCLVKNGKIEKIAEGEKNPFVQITSKFEDLFEDLYKHMPFQKFKINFLDPKNSSHFPIKALKENNILTHWGYDIEYGLGRSNYKLNSYEKDTYNELTDGNYGDYRDYDADISDLLDSMGRG